MSCRILAAFLVLTAVQPALGGIYETIPAASPLIQNGQAVPLPFELFRDMMARNQQKGIALPESKARREAIEARDRLQGKSDVVDLAMLGAVKLRLREMDSAVDTLKLAEGRSPRNFWVLTHLAAYYHMLGQVGDAVRLQEVAIDFFPPDASADAATNQWLRSSEKSLLKLMRLRVRERPGLSAGRAGPPADVDALFSIRFTNDDGSYSAGRPPSDPAELNAALAQTQQLLLWFPDDARLYWLLGELYNAQGDVEAALTIFNECVDARRLDAAKLREHRQILTQHLESLPKPETPSVFPEGPRLWLVAGAGGLVLLALVLLQIQQIRRWVHRRSQSSKGSHT